MPGEGRAGAGEAAVGGGWSLDFAGYSADQLLALVGDIESYPQYMPWCLATRVLARDGDTRHVDNVFGGGPVRVRFRTRATFRPGHVLEIISDERPFRRFRLTWRFADLARGGAHAEADYEIVFRSGILAALATVSMAVAERRIVEAFTRRARTLYGAPAGAD